MSELTLTKIKSVHLYVAFTEDASDCYYVSKMLRDANIPFTLLNFGDQEQHFKETLTAISTWPLGTDGHKKECSKFPILVWDECFSDWSVYRRIAHGIDEIKTCDVFTKKNLI